MSVNILSTTAQILTLKVDIDLSGSMLEVEEKILNATNE